MAGIRTVLIIDSNKEDRAKVAVFLEEYYNVMESASIGEAYRIQIGRASCRERV